MSWRPSEIDDIAKLGALAAAACYVLGLLAVNTFLLTIGGTEFSVFRPRFVVCGFLVVILLIAGAVSNHAIQRTIVYILRATVQKDEGNNTPPSASILCVAVIVAVMMFAFHRLEVPGFNVGWGFHFPLALLLLSLSIIISTCIESISIGFTAEVTPSELPTLSRSDKSDSDVRQANDLILPKQHSSELFRQILARQRELDALNASLKKVRAELEASEQELARIRDSARRGALLATVLALGCFALFVYQYSVRVMPEVPEQFGGANPRHALLVFAPSFSGAAVDLGIADPSSASVSVDTEILWEGEDSYLIRVTSSNGVARFKIAKASVSAIRFD